MKRVGSSLLVAVLACGGCEANEAPRDAPPSPADLARAESEVRRFYAAVRSGDCAAARALLPGLETEAECEQLVVDYRDHHVSLVDVSEVVVDGRDRNAFIVRSRVQRGDSTREMRIRAQRRDGRWTLVF